MFALLEQDGVLNIDNDKHIAVLRKVFLSRINSHLEVFRTAWNNHPLSSGKNYSPTQLRLMWMPLESYDMQLAEVRTEAWRQAIFKVFSNLIISTTLLKLSRWRAEMYSSFVTTSAI